jgi:hypothetical protein
MIERMTGRMIGSKERGRFPSVDPAGRTATGQ